MLIVVIENVLRMGIGYLPISFNDKQCHFIHCLVAVMTTSIPYVSCALALTLLLQHIELISLISKIM